MYNYYDIYDIHKTTLPLTRNVVEDILSKSVMYGFIQCPYSELIENIKRISRADTIEATLNPNTMYSVGKNPMENIQVVIRVEGMKDLKNFVDSILSGNENGTWATFTTYSIGFHDYIYDIKNKIIKKFLWNARNIMNWKNDNNISIIDSKLNELINDYDVFKEYILETDELVDFIKACDSLELKNTYSVLLKNTRKLITKYKGEFYSHLDNMSKHDESITLHNPIVDTIFVTSAYVMKCQKDWPRLKIVGLDRRQFDTLALY